MDPMVSTNIFAFWRNCSCHSHNIIGSVVVWVTISLHGGISVMILEGPQNLMYYTILQETEKINFDELFEVQLWTFYQQNAAIHIEQRVKQWFADNKIDI